MFLRSLYWILSGGALALMVADGPRAKLLTKKPERGQVTAAGASGKRTVRGRGPAFIWLGGGYHGGK